jgi:molecular chaperone Hsp33
MLIQSIAEDDTRGSTAEAWIRTQAFFETIGEDELIDPTLTSEGLLFRLFHEDGVRVFEPKVLKAVCRCSLERIIGVLSSFAPEEQADMLEDDGMIRVTCEYCASVYALTPEQLIAAVET